MSKLADYLSRQREWSAKTFGVGLRTKGILTHIRKELAEIEQSPFDREEWIDVIILALDGYWRHGGSPREIWAELQAKQDKNFTRQWPAPGVAEDQRVEHIRTTPLPLTDTGDLPTNTEGAKLHAGGQNGKESEPSP